MVAGHVWGEGGLVPCLLCQASASGGQGTAEGASQASEGGRGSSNPSRDGGEYVIRHAGGHRSVESEGLGEDDIFCAVPLLLVPPSLQSIMHCTASPQGKRETSTLRREPLSLSTGLMRTGGGMAQQAALRDGSQEHTWRYALISSLHNSFTHCLFLILSLSLSCMTLS